MRLLMSADPDADRPGAMHDEDPEGIRRLLLGYTR